MDEINIGKETTKHIKALLGVTSVEVTKNFSLNISYQDIKEYAAQADWEGPAHMLYYHTGKAASPFYRINESCIVDDGNKCSLIVYKAFAIVNDGITFIRDNVNYIFKDMDKHVYSADCFYGGERVKSHEAFIKNDTLYGYTYIDDGRHEIDIKGKVMPSSLSYGKDDSFYSVQGNVMYKNKITNVRRENGHDFIDMNYISLMPRIFHRDTKEIVNMEFVDLKYKNDGAVTEAPSIDFAAIITLADGTKRLLVKDLNGRKSSSKYFNDLELKEAYLTITPEEFEKETLENKSGWNGFDSEDSPYFIPGLTFNYTTDSEHGTFVVKKYGHMMVKTRHKN